GDVNGYISPSLAVGRDDSRGGLVWVFVGLFVFGVLALLTTVMWSAFTGKKARPLEPDELLNVDAAPWSGGLSAVPVQAPIATPVGGYTPNDQGVRLEQLKQLAALRDSGALTEDEFEAEKRRILNG
ncbi:MAG: hypothetical protein QOD39_3088, partial [Mycobacterium sp.]|nr:hypothetical protein [Mycobacterium sp.]